MPILPVTAARGDKKPAVVLDYPNRLADLHDRLNDSAYRPLLLPTFACRALDLLPAFAGLMSRLRARMLAESAPYSSLFFPPIVFSLANTASTLRSSRCFSVGSNSGSFRAVVSEAGSRVAP